MKINLHRFDFRPRTTLGRITIVGEKFESYSLEDKVRPDGVKIYGETAIPAGLYVVKRTRSLKFGKVLPEVFGVPNFKGIRIHAGLRGRNRPTTHVHTKGCPLPGFRFAELAGEFVLYDSGPAADELEDYIIHAETRAEGVLLEVTQELPNGWT